MRAKGEWPFQALVKKKWARVTGRLGSSLTQVIPFFFSSSSFFFTMSGIADKIVPRLNWRRDTRSPNVGNVEAFGDGSKCLRYPSIGLSS